MSEFSKEPLSNAEKISGLDGVTFEGTIGQSFKEIDITYPDSEASLRGLFERQEVKDIIAETRHFRSEYPQTFNGLLLGNPDISFEGDKLVIKAEGLHYQVYFGAHEYRKHHAEIGEQYAALSVCGIVYDSTNRRFYLSVRPSDSQEDPSKMDAPGGVLNPEYLDADPLETAKDRLVKKLGIVDLDIKNIGVEKIFNDKYSLYNLAMYAEVEDMLPNVEEELFSIIKLGDVRSWLASDKLTTPAKATLLLALAQPQFADFGWGAEKVKELVDSTT